jgi:hypothetical protein
VVEEGQEGGGEGKRRRIRADDLRFVEALCEPLFRC